MTDRQKEMLTKRALYGFLCEHPDLSMNDIDSYSLVTRIVDDKVLLQITLSHYVMYIELKNKKYFIYIPKERFSIKENENVGENENC